jgi:protein-tyrosine-phosphatase
MAEAIALDDAQKAGIELRVVSAGTSALTDHPAHEFARAAIEAEGLDLDAHRAQPVTRELVNDATLVVAVTRRHRDDLRYYFPNDIDKIVSFDDVTGLGDLDDPFGGGKGEFRRTTELLRRGMRDVLSAFSSRAQKHATEVAPSEPRKPPPQS